MKRLDSEIVKLIIEKTNEKPLHYVHEKKTSEKDKIQK